MTDVFPRRNLPGDAEQWGRAHDVRLIAAESKLSTVEQNVSGQNRSIASSLATLADQINALPIVWVGAHSVMGIGIAGAPSYWVLAAQVRVPVPQGKTVASVVAIGGAALLDTVTAGVTVAEAQIFIDGQGSPYFSAAKDVGASTANNILTPSFGRAAFTPSSSTILVQLFLAGHNPAAFPAIAENFGSLTVTATF